ncbi:ubiquitin C-terminal hydrolase [Crepidotus variabilis]|uniref:Ubiquitin carboxyl-terminal hydrolase n=1 Tax=Crepidotus variabilis TaxID=179855 RepID=A0A9P6EK89_9AGAR|nr:ubiquitin C-terminal hydrolase [Crepidotus variabilis]
MSDPHVQASKKRWVPLENNPEVMTKLAHTLGLSPNLIFQDVYSLTEPSLLAMVKRPCLAILFLAPTTEISTQALEKEEATQAEYEACGADEPVMWFRQTIGDACGLIGLLHCMTNGVVASHIIPGSDLDKLVKDATSLKPKERAELLYNSNILETVHKEAAQTGDSRPPAVGDPVDYYFTAFIKGKNGHLWEMEGWRKGPLDRGGLGDDEDLMSKKALNLGPLRIINSEKASEGRFSIIALVEQE